LYFFLLGWIWAGGAVGLRTFLSKPRVLISFGGVLDLGMAA